MKSVSSLRPDLPAGIDAWFDQVLARDASTRFASAALMSRALADATASRPSWTDAIPLVQRVTRDPRPTRWTRSMRAHRVVPFLTLAAAVGILVAASGHVKPTQIAEAHTATAQLRQSVVSMVGRVDALGEGSSFAR
jgi:hypothetical protein